MNSLYTSLFFFCFFLYYTLSFNGDKTRHHLLDFLIRVGHAYGIKKRPGDFIIDLLQLKAPNLFSSSQAETESSGETVAENFTRFLKKYLKQYHLRSEMTNRINEIQKCVQKDVQTMGSFYWIILNVLHSVSSKLR